MMTRGEEVAFQLSGEREGVLLYIDDLVRFWFYVLAIIIVLSCKHPV